MTRKSSHFRDEGLPPLHCHHVENMSYADDAAKISMQNNQIDHYPVF